MDCPNGHKGGVFCCEDMVNQAARFIWEKWERYEPSEPRLFVTIDQYEAWTRILEEQDESEAGQGEGRLDGADLD